VSTALKRMEEISGDSHAENFRQAAGFLNMTNIILLIDSANRPWPTNSRQGPRGGILRSGGAWLGRSQKDGLSAAVRRCRIETGSRPSTRARGAA